jgi:hypothetical protein
LGLRNILNADLWTLGVLGTSEDWRDWKIFEQYPSFTVIHPTKGRLFCFGMFDREDGFREAWTVITAQAPIKLVLKTIRLAIELYKPQVATITGRTSYEFKVCERFLKALGFTVPFENPLPMLAREGVM